MRLRRALYHLVNGVRSGIPLCCVLFFVSEYLRDTRRWRRGLGKSLNDERGDPWPLSRVNGQLVNVRYVRCDRCHEGDHLVEPRRNGVVLRRLLV